MSVQPSKSWKRRTGDHLAREQAREKAQREFVAGVIAGADHDWMVVDGPQCQAVVDAYPEGKQYVWRKTGLDSFAVIALIVFCKAILSRVRKGETVMVARDERKCREIVACVKDLAKAESSDAGKRLYGWEYNDGDWRISRLVEQAKAA